MTFRFAGHCASFCAYAPECSKVSDLQRWPSSSRECFAGLLSAGETESQSKSGTQRERRGGAHLLCSCSVPCGCSGTCLVVPLRPACQSLGTVVCAWVQVGQGVLLGGSGSREPGVLVPRLWRFPTTHQRTQTLGSQASLQGGRSLLLGLSLPFSTQSCSKPETTRGCQGPKP